MPQPSRENLRDADIDRRAAWHSPRELQQFGLHVDDLGFAMPFAWEEVLQAIEPGSDGLVPVAHA